LGRQLSVTLLLPLLIARCIRPRRRSQTSPFALRYSTNNGSTFTKYYYVLNLQGDVVKLINASGTTIANYSYSAYGEIISITDANGTEITSSTHVANINPLRYRGYYYDTETGFYYLQSRYYDPVIGRFINADGYASTGQGVLGMNMFAYCNNNPVNSVDPSGCSSSKMDEWIRLTEKTKRAMEMKAYLIALAFRESGGQPNDGYDAVNQYGFMGRYQLGHTALADIKWYDLESGTYTAAANAYGVYSDETFLGNKLAQETAVRLSTMRNWFYTRHFELTKHIGTTVRGVEVTPSGILGAMHLVGIGGMIQYFDPSQDTPQDGNQVKASVYMEALGGFEIVEWD
jgi:RHS repeat-associated protein